MQVMARLLDQLLSPTFYALEIKKIYGA